MCDSAGIDPATCRTGSGVSTHWGIPFDGFGRGVIMYLFIFNNIVLVSIEIHYHKGAVLIMLTLKPLLHFTGLVKPMETEQNPVKSVNVRFLSD